MPPVVSFRPTPEELETIEQVRKARGFETRAEAVRYLIRQGAHRTFDWRDDPLFRFTIERFVKPGEDLTSDDIDDALSARE